MLRGKVAIFTISMFSGAKTWDIYAIISKIKKVKDIVANGTTACISVKLEFF